MGFKIDDVDIPTPIKYQPKYKKITTKDSGDTLDGIYHEELVRMSVSYDLEFGLLTWQETSTLLGLTLGKESVTFYHPDPRNSSGWITRNFNISDVNCPPQTLETGKEMFNGISFSLEDIGDD